MIEKTTSYNSIEFWDRLLIITGFYIVCYLEIAASIAINPTLYVDASNMREIFYL
jgi:hypothetical protein